MFLLEILLDWLVLKRSNYFRREMANREHVQVKELLVKGNALRALVVYFYDGKSGIFLCAHRVLNMCLNSGCCISMR